MSGIPAGAGQLPGRSPRCPRAPAAPRSRTCRAAYLAADRGLPEYRTSTVSIPPECISKPLPGPRSRSQLHDLFLFGLRDVVDHRDVLVGQVLDALLAGLALVLGDVLVLLGVLHHVH